MKLHNVLKKIGVPRFKDLSPEERLEVTKKWREKREEAFVRLRATKK